MLRSRQPRVEIRKVEGGGGGGHGKVRSCECDIHPKLTPANCLWSASETGQTASFVLSEERHTQKNALLAFSLKTHFLSL